MDDENREEAQLVTFCYSDAPSEQFIVTNYDLIEIRRQLKSDTRFVEVTSFGELVGVVATTNLKALRLGDPPEPSNGLPPPRKNALTW